MLLVDFNLAEHLGPEISVKQIYRTVSCVSILIRKLPDAHFYQGTPIFMARAVERGGHLPVVLAVVPEITVSPDRYAEVHPDRVEKFLDAERLVINPKEIDDNERDDGWRHELDHDAESVFWLILYWAMVVQPEECPKETIDSTSWPHGPAC